MAITSRLPACIVVLIIVSTLGIAAPSWMPGRDRFARWQLESWNEKHGAKARLELRGLAANERTSTFMGHRLNGSARVSGIIVNNSPEDISFWIVDLVALSKQTQRVVLKRRVAIFWLAPKSLQREFKEVEMIGPEPGEFLKIMRELGGDAAWSYSVVAVVPVSLEKVGFDSALDVGEHWTVWDSK